MPYEYHDPATWFAVGRALFVLLLFHAPGFLWASALHRDEGYGWPFRIALGWAYSFAVFAPLAWLFLWTQGTMSFFLIVLGGVWVAFTSCAIVAWWRPGDQLLPAEPPPATVAAPCPGSFALLMLLAAAGYAAVCLLYTSMTVYANNPERWQPDQERWFIRQIVAPVYKQFDIDPAAWKREHPGHGILTRRALGSTLSAVGCNPDEWQNQEITPRIKEWIWFGIGAVLLLCLGVPVALGCRWLLRSWAAFAARDEAAPSWTAMLLLLVMVFAQAGSAAAFDRADSDDCYYLALQLDFAEGGAFNVEEPTHREGLPVQSHNLLLAWDLWAAVVCKLSGLNPMALSHSILPPILVLLAYAAYWQVLAEYLPRRWVALALLGTSAYYVWGIGSHHAANNYLLTRMWQGKTVLIHLSVPLMLVTQTRFLREPTVIRWLALLAATLSGLAASSSAVFLCPIVLFCLAVAFLGVTSWRDWLSGLVGSWLACAPAVAYGLLIRQRVLAEGAVAPERWPWTIGWWFSWIPDYSDKGNWEFFWLLLLPLIAFLLWNYRRLAYPLLFFVVLLLTFNNPLLSPFIANNITSIWTYFRIFWLWPVAIGMGILLALGSRLLTRLAEAAVRAPLEHRWLGGLPELLTLGGLFAAYSCLTGMYVWSAENNGVVWKDYKKHHVTPNLLKMPPDLVVCADKMLADGEIKSLRVLCPDEVSSYLTPYTRSLRFVETRGLYTYAFFALAGRDAEGQDRFLLGLMLKGKVPQYAGEMSLQEEHGSHPVATTLPWPPRLLTAPVIQDMLDELHVRYAIWYSDAKGAYSVPQKLAEAGFRKHWEGELFTLWKR